MFLSINIFPPKSVMFTYHDVCKAHQIYLTCLVFMSLDYIPLSTTLIFRSLVV